MTIFEIIVIIIIFITICFIIYTIFSSSKSEVEPVPGQDNATSATTTKTKKAGKGFWYYFWKIFWFIFAFMLFLLLAVKVINAIKTSFVEKNESKHTKIITVDTVFYSGQTPCSDVPLSSRGALYCSGPVYIMYQGMTKLERIYFSGSGQLNKLPHRKSSWVTVMSTNSETRDVLIRGKITKVY